MSDDDRARWDARYRRGEEGAGAPSPFVLAAAEHVPRRGRALDVAAGAGRNGLWLASRGLDVCLVDISPVGLGLAEERAARAGLRVRTVAADLEREPLPPGRWDVVVWTSYLQRSLFPAVRAALAPGGLWIFAHPTARNLERHPRPSRRFLLAPGELAGEVGALEVLVLEEGWTAEGRHEARLLARRPA